MSSRWATNPGDDAQASNERKRKKEEKRRQRESRQIQKQVNTVNIIVRDTADSLSSERPAKRQRTTPSQEETTETVHLLEFPTPIFQRSGSLDQYQILNDIEEGSYGYVSRAEHKTSGDVVAVKRLKLDHNSDGFPVTGLREIETLRACSHPHIVNLREVIVSDDSIQE